MEPTHLPPIGWVDALPRNYWYLRKVESQAKPEKREMECGECPEGEPVEQIVGVCLDCDEPLCDFHWTAHQKGRRTKGHTLSRDVEGLSKMASNDAEKAQLQSTGVPCAIHVDHNVNGFCKTCGERVCKVCQERSHRQHEIDSDFQMESICAQRRDLERDLEMTDTGLDSCEESIAELNACIYDVNLEAAEASKDVTASVQRLVDDLRKEEKLALRQIDETRWSLQKKLDEKLEQKKAARSQLERARYLTRASLFEDVNNAQLHHVGNLLRRNLNKAQRECGRQLDPSDLPSPDVVHDGCRKLTAEVKSFNAKLRSRHVLVAQPAGEQCSLQLEEYDGDRPAIHQSTWRNVVQLPSDNATLKPGDEVSAAIENPLGEIEPCTVSAFICNEEDNPQDGQFEVHFDMKIPGEHKLHVAQNGRHVHGSPCKINVGGFPLDKRTYSKGGVAQDQSRKFTFAKLPETSAVKFGVYVPKMPTSDNGSKCDTATGVMLFTDGEEGKRVYVGCPVWQANGEFEVDERTSTEEAAAEVESCEQEWEDEEVMQMEFSYVHPQWTLKLTHLRSGKSSTARGYLECQLCAVVAFVACPENSRIHFLPAFF